MWIVNCGTQNGGEVVVMEVWSIMQKQIWKCKMNVSHIVHLKWATFSNGKYNIECRHSIFCFALVPFGIFPINELHGTLRHSDSTTELSISHFVYHRILLIFNRLSSSPSAVGFHLDIFLLLSLLLHLLRPLATSQKWIDPQFVPRPQRDEERKLIISQLHSPEIAVNH